MRIGVIGAGYIANRHCASLSKIPDITIVGHTSRRLESAESATERWGGKAYSSIHAMLQEQSVDAAYVCIPPFAHGEIEHTLIATDTPFYVEKPLSIGLEPAREIATAIQTRGLIVAAGYHWRAMSGISELRAVLRDHPPYLIRAAWHDATRVDAWWRHQSESGGQILEQASHLFDIVRYLVGKAAPKYVAVGHHSRPDFPDADINDVSIVVLEYEAGALGVFTATCILPRPIDVNVEFYCNRLKIKLTRSSIIYEWRAERSEMMITTDPLEVADQSFVTALLRNDPSNLVCSYAEALETHKLCCEISDLAVLSDPGSMSK